MAIYDKPVRLLLQDMVKEFGLNKGDTVTRAKILSWFHTKYPKIKDGTISAHLIRMSTNAPSRIHYLGKPPEKDDLLYQVDSQTFRLYDVDKDPKPIYEDPIQDSIDGDPDEDLTQASQPTEFAYEKDLQNFLAKNLSVVEPGLKLYEDEGITGIEFPVGNRFIDILALDKDNNFVVIELKVSKGYDRVVGQLLRYMAWIKENQADTENGQQVRGIIVARKISEDLRLACSLAENIKLYEYEISVKLNPVGW